MSQTSVLGTQTGRVSDDGGIVLRRGTTPEASSTEEDHGLKGREGRTNLLFLWWTHRGSFIVEEITRVYNKVQSKEFFFRM